MQVYVGVSLLMVLIQSSMSVKTLPNRNSLSDGRERIEDAINTVVDGSYIQNGRLQFGMEAQGYNEGEFTGQRRKRSVTVLSRLAKKGHAALKLLLKGTFPIKSRKYNVQEFEKIGTLKTALKDFKDTAPSSVQKIIFPNGITGRTGYTGDRAIVLKARGDDGKPYIEIVKMHKTGDEIDPRIYKITYTNKLTN